MGNWLTSLVKHHGILSNHSDGVIYIFNATIDIIEIGIGKETCLFCVRKWSV